MLLSPYGSQPHLNYLCVLGCVKIQLIFYSSWAFTSLISEVAQVSKISGSFKYPLCMDLVSQLARIMWIAYLTLISSLAREIYVPTMTAHQSQHSCRFSPFFSTEFTPFNKKIASCSYLLSQIVRPLQKQSFWYGGQPCLEKTDPADQVREREGREQPHAKPDLFLFLPEILAGCYE